MSGQPGGVIPCLCYRDAYAAIEWLCGVLGFERRLVVPDEQGGVAHAQLALGDGMVMLGTARENDPEAIVFPPGPDGTLTQAVLVVAPDVEARYERAKAAGANVIMELTPQHYGGSLFAVRDPEGQLWHVGSYDPWAEGEQEG